MDFLKCSWYLFTITETPSYINPSLLWSILWFSIIWCPFQRSFENKSMFTLGISVCMCVGGGGGGQKVWLVHNKLSLCDILSCMPYKTKITQPLVQVRLTHLGQEYYIIASFYYNYQSEFFILFLLSTCKFGPVLFKPHRDWQIILNKKARTK